MTIGESGGPIKQAGGRSTGRTYDNTNARRYHWIVERARSGEPVALDLSRRDMPRIIDFLAEIDGHGLSMQIDQSAGLVWVARTEGT